MVVPVVSNFSQRGLRCSVILHAIYGDGGAQWKFYETSFVDWKSTYRSIYEVPLCSKLVCSP